ncbi:DNA-protecting protein DprA [candidate division KSB1 bacterium]|nr:DNA-protecting protein DprA [candidate division KSB1 bacterium]
MANRDEVVALLNLLSVEGIGPTTAVRLVSKFGSAIRVFSVTEHDLRDIPRFSETLVARLHAARPDAKTGAIQYDRALELGARICTYWDEDYPIALKQIESDAPAVLFIRGSFPATAKRLAVVGTRSASAYGSRVTRDLILGMRGSGFHIVSGLASGIDGFAHGAAIEAGLPTEAVFGCGIDIIYPSTHVELSEQVVAAGGALLSEYAPGKQPERTTFPQRNRIIAGLSLATLVVEAGDTSGALITANLAVDYNREVMAVPGAINNPKSRGCHRLIKDGAALVEKAEDILQLLDSRLNSRQYQVAQQELNLDLPASERDLLTALHVSEATHIDVLSDKLSLPVGETLGRLLMLELKGIVKQLPGKYFVRA